jgi:four helix bundle protein
MARDRTKLKAFKLAHQLAVTVFRATRSFPAAERDIRSQLRRASSSVPSNIAEGCARRSKGDYLRFLDIALGSGSEADYLIDFCREVDLLDPGLHAECKYYSQQVVRALQKLVEAVERFDS